VITKLRTATQRTQTCADCGKVINLNEKYYDSDEKAAPPKPFPTRKFCSICGEKRLNEQKM